MSDVVEFMTRAIQNIQEIGNSNAPILYGFWVHLTSKYTIMNAMDVKLCVPQSNTNVKSFYANVTSLGFEKI